MESTDMDTNDPDPGSGAPTYNELIDMADAVLDAVTPARRFLKVWDLCGGNPQKPATRSALAVDGAALASALGVVARLPYFQQHTPAAPATIPADAKHPAAPVPHGANHFPGVTIRDYFAARAMFAAHWSDQGDYAEAAARAYAQADAMLRERDRVPLEDGIDQRESEKK